MHLRLTDCTGGLCTVRAVRADIVELPALRYRQCLSWLLTVESCVCVMGSGSPMKHRWIIVTMMLRLMMMMMRRRHMQPQWTLCNQNLEQQDDVNVITYGCSAHLLNLLAHDLEISNVTEHVVYVMYVKID